MDEDEQRICAVFGAPKVPRVSKRTLATYRVYLDKHLSPGCLVTGREDFPWEERYIFGAGDPDDYESLKKDNPSFSDEYRILRIMPEASVANDLVAQVERLSDGKHFEVALSYLEAVDQESNDFVYLDDYATWQANW